MEWPKLTDPEGLFKYIIALVLLTAAAAGVLMYVGVPPF